MTTTTRTEARRQLTRQAAHVADLNNDLLNPLGEKARDYVRTLIADAQQHTRAGRYNLARHQLDRAWEMLEG